jgi:cyclopropane-fatty-acyl-phospholipid synthase
LQFAHERYGATGVGVTVSKEQARLAQKRVAGLPIDIRFEDYRKTQGQFDHIISVGMFEHVGPSNYRSYFEVADRLLKDGGYFLLHTIGSRHTSRTTDPWIDRYIFPNGVLPSIAQIGKAVEELFVMEDWHNFGPDYDKTLVAWDENFKCAWPELKGNYSERFYRMWRYYLMSCAGGFRARHMQLWQIALSKKGTVGGYRSVR